MSTHEEHHADALAAALSQYSGILRAELAGTKLGVAIKGAEVRALKATGVEGTTAVSGRVSFSPGRLMGFALRETSGAASATVYLRDGIDAAGDLIIPIQLAPGESTREYYSFGLSFVSGLYFELAAGGVEGVVFLNGTND